jgi:hypothetical protein
MHPWLVLRESQLGMPSTPPVNQRTPLLRFSFVDVGNDLSNQYADNALLEAHVRSGCHPKPLAGRAPS